MRDINKKGISPLLATIMLVAFVIVLAVLVWFWYSGIIIDMTEKSGTAGNQVCASDVSFTINSAQCLVDSNINFEVENLGSFNIHHFNVIIKGVDAASSELKETALGAMMGTTQQLSVTNETVSKVYSIDIIPLISSQGRITECTEIRHVITVDGC